MIDESVLNKLISFPEEEEKMREIQVKLKESGFPINNFNKGGIFYIIIRICVKIGLEIKQLARSILNSCFIRHAEGEWLILKAADFGKFQKEAVKAQGYITLYRSDFSYSLSVKRGHMFKTKPDINGREYKFYAIEETIIEAGEVTGNVLVEAEESGSDYNVPVGSICVSMIHLEGVETISNEDGWLYREGSEAESMSSLRSRTLSAWDEIAERTIDEKLRNAARSVPGVLDAEINSQHPRGQGTVDIIITSTAGEPTESLLLEVGKAIEYLRGNYDDFLCKSSTIVRQDITVQVFLARDVSTDGIREQCESLIYNMLQLGNRNELNCLYLDDIRVLLAEHIRDYKRAVFAIPDQDMELPKDQVIMAGEITVTVANVGGGSNVS